MTSGVTDAHHAVAARRPIEWTDVLFALTPISLFIAGAIGPKIIFYMAMCVLILVTQWRTFLTPRAAQIAFSPILTIFAAVHVAMAFYTSFGEGVYRGVQMLSAYVFVVPFVVRYSALPMDRFYRYIATFIGILVVGVVGWHLANGYKVTWKYLWDTKTAYSLMPFMMVAFVTSRTPAALKYGWMLVAATALIILLSGERKAYVLLAIGFGLMMNFRNPLTYLLPVALLAIGPLASALDPTGYINAQISTLTGFAQGDVVQTLSNRQREWQINYINELSSQHPLIGIGTGSYVSTMVETYAGSTSEVIRPGLGVHGEFFRVKVENGLLGLVPWVLLVLTSAWAAVFSWRERPRSFREHKLAGFLFFSLFLYMLFEATDTTMMVCYCLLPHVWRLRLATPAPQSAAT